MAIEQRLMTADDLLSLPYDGLRRELLRGKLRTMPPTSWDHADETSILDGSLGPYVRGHKLGRVLTGEPGFVLARNPDTVRAPDVAFVRRERLPARGSTRRYFDGAPDLAVEVISPHDRYKNVDEKVAEWLAHGTRLVFVVNPRRLTVDVHRPGQPPKTLGIGDMLDGDDVVPGWTLRVCELFEQE